MLKFGLIHPNPCHGKYICMSASDYFELFTLFSVLVIIVSIIVQTRKSTAIKKEKRNNVMTLVLVVHVKGTKRSKPCLVDSWCRYVSLYGVQGLQKQ